LRKVKGNDTKVLVCLCCVVYAKAGNCRRSRTTLSKMTGIPIGQISVHTGNLQRLGIIKKWRNGNATYYTLCKYPPKNLDEILNAPQISVQKTRTHIPRDELGMFKNDKDRTSFTVEPEP